MLGALTKKEPIVVFSIALGALGAGMVFLRKDPVKSRLRQHEDFEKNKFT